MQNGVSGFKVEGTWAEVVEHGERITRALRQAGLATASAGEDDLEQALEEWEAWRPKHHDTLEEDIRQKTADQASIGQGAGEQAGKHPVEDLREARDRFFEGLAKAEAEGLQEAVTSIGESIGRLGRAADSAGRKALRSVEAAVYQGVMTRVTPYYFDNELVSADLSRTRRTNGRQASYSLEVNVQDDRLKNRVARILAEQDDPAYTVASDHMPDGTAASGRR